MFFKEFCAIDECNKYVRNYNLNLKRSLVVDNKKNTENSERTSRSKLLNNEDISLKKLIRDISALVGLPESNCEPIVFTKYEVGEEYKPHFDAFIEPSNNNQRLYTALLYLSSFNGGETKFDNIDKVIRPKIGDLCIFENCLSGTSFINPGSLHSGLKVKSGEKFIMTFWFREKSF